MCFYAAGKLNNTKSVGFALDTYLSSEIYRFLKRAAPVKRIDFAIVALDNDLINHQISFRPIMRASCANELRASRNVAQPQVSRNPQIRGGYVVIPHDRKAHAALGQHRKVTADLIGSRID